MKLNLKPFLLIGCLALTLTNLRAADPALLSGKVVETMSTAGYTYVQVATGDKKVWAAAVQFDVKVGDTVSFAPGDAMPNYHSKSLNRDFDLVYFTGGIDVVNSGVAAPAAASPGADKAVKLPPGHPALPAPTTTKLPPGHPALPGTDATALPPGHPDISGVAAQPKLAVTAVKRAEGGQTIAEIIGDAKKLSGKTVTVRGKVVKYNGEILGKNWLHIQDGSGSADKMNNDLTITSTMSAKLGDIVLVSGTLATDRDFGANYKYKVIVESATVVAE